MFSLLFRNRWLAMGYVALTLVSASLFVDHDGGADRLAQATRQLQAQRTMLAQAATPAASPSPRIIEAPAPKLPLLLPVAGSIADPADPKVGDVFIDPATGRKVRAVRREDAGQDQPAFPGR